MIQSHCFAAFLPLIFRHGFLVNAKGLNILMALYYDMHHNTQVDIKKTGGAYDVAAINANRHYGGRLNVTVTYLFDRVVGSSTCDILADVMVQQAAEAFYRNAQPDTCFAVVTSPCGDWPGIISLANGHAWPVMTTASVTTNVLKKKTTDYTPVFGLTGSYSKVAIAILELLRYFKYHRAGLLMENVVVFKNTGQAVLDIVRENFVNEFRLEYRVFDFTANRSLENALDAVKPTNRVIILLTNGPNAAKVLQTAAKRDMGNGDFVFLNYHATASPTMLTNLPEMSSITTNTSALSNILRSFIVLSHGEAHDFPEPISSAVVKRTKEEYDYSYESKTGKRMPTFNLILSYATVELLAIAADEILNQEHHSRNDRESSCSDLNSRILDRRFNLTTGELYIDSYGLGSAPIKLFAASPGNRSINMVGEFSWFPQQHFTWEKAHFMDWPTVDGQPPPDVPPCGFSGREGPCASESISIAGPLVGAAVIGLLVSLLTIRHIRQLQRLETPWWCLEAAILCANRKRSECEKSKGSIIRPFDAS